MSLVTMSRRELIADGLKKNEEYQALFAKGDDRTVEDCERQEALGREMDEIKTHLSRFGGEAKSYDFAPSAPNRPALGGTAPPGTPANPVGRDGATLLGGNHPDAIKSLGQAFIESSVLKRYNPSQKMDVGEELPGFLSPTDNIKATFTSTASGLTAYDRAPGIILLEQQRLTVADLMPSTQVSFPSFVYFQETSLTNAADMVAEVGLKPEATFATDEATANVRKIGVVGRVTDEQLEDYPFLRGYIDGRLRFMVAAREEAQLLNGPGTGNTILGILAADIQTQAQGSDTAFEAIHKAITKVRSVGFMEPDGIVIHPTDYQMLRLEKDGNQQYLGGGPFTGAYGNGGVPMQPGPWGLRPVITTAITQGTALVGCFRLGAMVLRRNGVQVATTNSDGDDFSYNRTAIRVEERVGIAVWRPLAFCTVTSLAQSA
jgi:HK97 family phage major capsid protein